MSRDLKHFAESHTNNYSHSESKNTSLSISVVLKRVVKKVLFSESLLRYS